MKACYVCLAVVLNFIVFWVPHFVQDVIELTSEEGEEGGHHHHDGTGNQVEVVVKQLTLCTSLTDPVLFVCLSTGTQNQLKKVLRRRVAPQASQPPRVRRVRRVQTT